MIRNLFLSLLLVLGGSVASLAQKDFRPGFVIMLSGDTVKCEIDYRGDLLMGSLCRTMINNEEKEYSPSEIQAYRFVDGKYFVSKDVPLATGKQKTFLEFMINGKLNVYYLRDAEGDHYYIEKDSLPIVELPYQQVKQDKNGREYTAPSTTHIGILNYYTLDASDMYSKVEKIKRPQHENLISLAKTYHYKVCKDESCIVYEKKVSRGRVNVEISGGVTSISDSRFEKQSSFTFGAIAHIWLPKTNEKLYLRTGFITTKATLAEGGPGTFTKIPVHIEYMPSKGKINPRISYGINLCPSVDPLVSISAGLNCKLGKSVSLMLNSDFDFDSTARLIPHTYFSSSFMAGLYFKM